MLQLHTILCFLLCFSGFFVSFSKSPISSVFYLIVAFLNSSILLFIINTEFLGLMFIIIYVGAVAVLFLFVIMMLNIKSQETSFNEINYIHVFLFCLVFSVFVLLYFQNFLNNSNSLIDYLSLPFAQLNLKYTYLYYDNLNNIDVLGQVLYNYYLPCFLIVGIILLTGLLGAIVLTSKFNKLQQSQKIFRQLSRKDSFISYFS